MSDPIHDHVMKLATLRGQHLEMFAAAWVRDNPDLPIEKAELVEQRSEDGLTTRWWCQERLTDKPAQAAGGD